MGGGQALNGGPEIVEGGARFAVRAPHAESVSVVGDWNAWDVAADPLEGPDAGGNWSGEVQGPRAGSLYKFYIRTRDGRSLYKADPLARATETPPGTASRLFESRYKFRHAGPTGDTHRRPLSIYEVHLGSWRRGLGYRELAPKLADHVRDLGFTHIELLPVMEHPFAGSWGYQTTAWFAPTARFGTPDDLRLLVDHMHERGIGVLLDWVPGHFPKDEAGLGRFDGTALYEHPDPRRGDHPDWGTWIFNFGSAEVRRFLLDSALFWLDAFRVDGLRIDAVASMLYLDYSRGAGDWLPNEKGGNENLDAVSFLRELNDTVRRRFPHALIIAEESTAWPNVTAPTASGGLGFSFKWNMGWMNDTLSWFTGTRDDRLTRSLDYAWAESFILPLSHDEVVHGKGSMLRKMDGRHDLLRALYAYMWAHPGKKLLFMGNEIAQAAEWDHDGETDWPGDPGVRDMIRELNRIYREEPALFAWDDSPDGFEWIEKDQLVAFNRKSAERRITCVCNFSDRPLPSPRGREQPILTSGAAPSGGRILPATTLWYA